MILPVFPVHALMEGGSAMPSDYILIGADLVPTESNTELFIQGDAENLVGERLKDILDRAAYRIFNLETPLTDMRKPIIKQGPNLIAPTATVKGYKAFGVDLLTLANNHIMDQDIQGLKSTVETLNKVGINHLGAGKDLVSAAVPFIFEFGGKKAGVYACAEHEFSIAGEDKPGANPFDPLWSLDHVAKLKGKTDFVIVLYHGGKEHYRYPSPDLQKICRRLVDKGADLVICQHSHCIGCEERYRKGIIVYGQGNFIFDDSSDECWQTSLLVKMDADLGVSYLPLVKTGNGVRLADEMSGQKILDGFRFRSEEIQKPGYIEMQYAQFADSFLDFYLRALSGKKSVWFRIFNRLSKGAYMKRYLQKTYGTASIVGIANYIDCEAHKELLSKAMKNGYERKTKWA